MRATPFEPALVGSGRNLGQRLDPAVVPDGWDLIQGPNPLRP